MRVTHTNRREYEISINHMKHPNIFYYWNISRGEERRSHIYFDECIILPENELSLCYLYAYSILFGETNVDDILIKASGTITTHLYFTSILVINSVPKIMRLRWLNDKYLVTSDSKMPIPKLFCKFRREDNFRMSDSIYDDEVISETMHFCKWNIHKVSR